LVKNCHANLQKLPHGIAIVMVYLRLMGLISSSARSLISSLAF